MKVSPSSDLFIGVYSIVRVELGQCRVRGGEYIINNQKLAKQYMKQLNSIKETYQQQILGSQVSII